MFAVDQAVSGEVDDAVLAQLSACGKLTVSFKACGFERRAFGRKPRDEFGLLVGKNEAAEAVTMKAPSRTLKLGWQRGKGGRRFGRSDTGDQTVCRSSFPCSRHTRIIGVENRVGQRGERLRRRLPSGAFFADEGER